MRLGRALLAAATLGTALTTLPAPATAGVDTTLPAVGSCHDLTYEEGYDASDTEAPVECTEPHTTVTVTVVELESPIGLRRLPAGHAPRPRRPPEVAGDVGV